MSNYLYLIYICRENDKIQHENNNDYYDDEDEDDDNDYVSSIKDDVQENVKITI